MLSAGNFRHRRMGTSRHQDIFGRDRFIPVENLNLMGPRHRRARQEAVDTGILQRTRVEPVQPVDLDADIVDQRRPIEPYAIASPAERLGIFNLVTISAAIDEQLLRHAAADNACAADAIFLGNADASAGLRCEPRGANPARARANNE